MGTINWCDGTAKLKAYSGIHCLEDAGFLRAVCCNDYMFQSISLSYKYTFMRITLLSLFF